MKKLFYTFAFLMSFDSSALVLNAVGSDAHVVIFPAGCARAVGGIFMSLDCLSTTTTSLPSILVQDEGFSIESDELESFLYSEMEADETPVTDTIAQKLGVSSFRIQEIVFELIERGEALSIENIRQHI